MPFRSSPATTIFLYEYVTGGGMLCDFPDEPPSGSLLAEGEAMVNALAEDFLQIDDCEVTVFHDSRLPPSELGCEESTARR